MALKLNITVRLVGYLLAASLLPLLLFGLISYDVTRGTIVDLATGYSRQQLAAQSHYLDLQIAQIESLAANIAGVQDVLNVMANADAEEAREAAATGRTRNDPYQRLATQAKVGYILNGYSNLKGLVSIDLYTPKGRHFHVGDTLSVTDTDQAARQAYYERALAASDQIVWIGVADNLNLHSTNGKVVIATKVLRHYAEAERTTQAVGMLMISYSTDHLHEHFSGVDFGANAYMLVVDADDRLIYHPDRSAIGTTVSPSFRRLLAESRAGSETVRLADQKVLLSQTALPNVPWRIVSVIPQETLLLPMQRLHQTGWILGLLCLVIVAIVTRTFARSVVAPIRAISSGFRTIQEKPQADLEHLPVPRTRDEIAEMVAWFNAFLDALRARRKTEEVIWNQANFDSLTGLPNRRLFKDRLTTELHRSARGGQMVALCFVDLDGFKEVNDSFGHEVGDELLVEAGRRIERCVRRSDTVARLGGDEFTVLVSALHDAEYAGTVADKILHAIEQPFEIAGNRCHVSASVGISFGPSDSTDAEGLLQNADRAMYASKREGKNRYTYFSPVMRDGAQSRQSIRGQLRTALAERQFSLHFQPILELSTGRMLKAEALLRWTHPSRGPVSPAEFIPIAEETGVINDIGEWVFEEALHWAGRWSRLAGRPIQISINRSPIEFRDKPQDTRWAERIREAGLPGDCIAVEITEGLLLNASPKTVEQLRHYREAGIEVSIDDFGTGYSSMAYLRKFDIDYLKIDRSFVSEMESNESDRAITEAIIGMAHKLGIRVIGEGIETEGQRAMLAAAGCDFGQGYLFAKPLAAEAFERRFVVPARAASDSNAEIVSS